MGKCPILPAKRNKDETKEKPAKRDKGVNMIR